MKKVFDNRQVAHVWAQQNQPEGRSGNGNLYFDNRTIYSYGRHFPLAAFFNDDIVFINDDSYSVSTAKHQGYVRQAVNHKIRIYAPTKVIQLVASYPHGPEWLYAIKRDLTAHFKTKIDALILKAATANKINRPKYLSQAQSLSFTAAKINDDTGLDFVDVGDLPNIDHFDLDALKAEEKRKAEVKRAKEKAAYEVSKTQWLNHQSVDNHAAIRNGDTLLRLKNAEEIETSAGASFPRDHAIKAFKLIRLVKEAGGGEWRPEQKSIHLGHFRIDSIDENGNVKAGCHFVKWPAIEHVARLLKIYP